MQGDFAAQKRLDQILIERKIYQSRSRAIDAIKRGCVFIDNKKALKPGQKCADDAKIEIKDAASAYVSRAALKLIKGLEVTNYSPKDKTAIDIGASTGGFTQVLLEKGAAHVFAIDVGHDQLVENLRHNENVTAIDGLNIKNFGKPHLQGREIDFLVCDVSFISLKKALPNILALANVGAEGIFLIKPQFEVGKDNLNKNGIVKSENLAHQQAKELFDWFGQQAGWQATHLAPSPITGSDGNIEFLLGGKKHGRS